ncbi:hypothetical protein LTR62_000136 [Meristemomyces frigidus]|uniref:Zn(2)-C6 fungal-type domain-containing protein n=1 Tax=Meristemomyces frigidus TaxID=1508187 RepID=A0AAN7TK39_9PEZI|nr:hypothetical protein LTR62_000136 [Meristemomyces frigidus]
MDVNSMLSTGAQGAAEPADGRRQNHSYSTRHTGPQAPAQAQDSQCGAGMHRPARGSHGGATFGAGHSRGSPNKKEQKHVVFQLIDPEDPRIQARLPMRVMISPHDPTDSIITTVKNFYGLYEYGVSFENREGISIIAAYENFEPDMIVYVRTVPQPANVHTEHGRDVTSPKKPTLGAPFEMRPPHLNGHSPSRSAARSNGVRSTSPHPQMGKRSGSAAPSNKPRLPRTKSTENSVLGDADGYSSGENDGGSVTSSRRSKTEQVNAEISVNNIVEGGRRNRAFESSELPLFVPPQVPVSASISSISPQRRNGPGTMASPYAQSNQHTFAYNQPLPSPHSYGGSGHYTQPAMPNNGFNHYQASRPLRGKPSMIYPPARHSGGVMPTPDPTVGSAISDEDVALQLMRLGDPAAFSHGRTSTSTLDDALSGKAELASSVEQDSEDEVEDEKKSKPAVPGFHDVGPQRKKQRTMNEMPSDGTSGEDYDDQRDGTFDGAGGMRKMGKSKGTKPRAMSMGKPKHKSVSVGPTKVPMSPSSLPAQSRKGSITSTLNFHHQLGADEDDLSSKPRCQRCRKSKKGCDRQRPCGRCKDAGIGVDGCVSEDEGNGRKGRYGRHMGVPIKKGEEGYEEEEADVQQAVLPANGLFLAPALPDKSKKRKR